MSALQEIYVLNKRLKLFHSEHGFKTSMDSVLLAASCPARAGDHILDMGCGVGGAGFCVLSRIEGTRLTGVEIQADHVALAKQNAEVNMMQGRSNFIESDIREYREEKTFDHVICNPPYLEAGHHLESPHDEKATAMGHIKEAPCPQAGGRDGKTDYIKEWVDAAYFCLKSNATFSMIHRADKTDKIILGLGKRFGAVEIFPLWPKASVKAKRVIIRAVKDRRSPATLHSGLVLHNEDGSYTRDSEKALRDKEPLWI